MTDGGVKDVSPYGSLPLELIQLDADNLDETWAEASVALAVEIADLEGWDWIVEVARGSAGLEARGRDS